MQACTPPHHTTNPPPTHHHRQPTPPYRPGYVQSSMCMRHASRDTWAPHPVIILLCSFWCFAKNGLGHAPLAIYARMGARCGAEWLPGAIAPRRYSSPSLAPRRQLQFPCFPMTGTYVKVCSHSTWLTTTHKQKQNVKPTCNTIASCSIASQTILWAQVR